MRQIGIKKRHVGTKGEKMELKRDKFESTETNWN